MPKLPSDEESVPDMTPGPVKGSLPLKWHGGKFYLADKIIKMFPSHIHYVEPYFGGGAVLFRKPHSNVSEVTNDINNELMNFWRVLQSPSWFEGFRQWCEATPFSEESYNRAVASVQSSKEDHQVVRAWCFFVRYRQSRQGLGKDFATVTRNRTRRGMNEQVSSWLSAVEGLQECHERLKRVLILNRPALDVIKTQDGDNTLFYLDPPYLQETRTAKWCFEYEMSAQDHSDLLMALDKIKGKFLLSGYRSKLYDHYAEQCGWNREEIRIPNNASSSKEKKIMTECVWRNF